MERMKVEPAMVAHNCHHSTWEVEEGESEVQGYPWLSGNFKVSLDKVRPVSKIKIK